MRILFAVFVIMAGTNLTAYGKTRVLVFAAASMKNVLEVIGKEYERNCDCKIVYSFASSGTLARQIEAGAPADIFVSADIDWMDWLKNRNAIAAETVGIIASNRLIIVLSDGALDASGETPIEIFANKRIAMANPISVPAGRYAKQALKKLKLWDGLQKQLVFGENVRISLALAARGDVGAAIVYQSDLKIEPRVKLAYLFDVNLHKAIAYPAGLVRENSQASEFLSFLKSKPAKLIFTEFGFTTDKDD